MDRFGYAIGSMAACIAKFEEKIEREATMWAMMTWSAQLSISSV